MVAARFLSTALSFFRRPRMTPAIISITPPRLNPGPDNRHLDFFSVADNLHAPSVCGDNQNDSAPPTSSARSPP